MIFPATLLAISIVLAVPAMAQDARTSDPVDLPSYPSGFFDPVIDDSSLAKTSPIQTTKPEDDKGAAPVSQTGDSTKPQVEGGTPSDKGRLKGRVVIQDGLKKQRTRRSTGIGFDGRSSAAGSVGTSERVPPVITGVNRAIPDALEESTPTIIRGVNTPGTIRPGQKLRDMFPILDEVIFIGDPPTTIAPPKDVNLWDHPD